MLNWTRRLTSALVVRAGFQERNTARDFVLDPQANLGLMSLSITGSSFYREFQLTGQYKVKRGMLNASYVRSKAFGNLNDFQSVFRKLREPGDQSGWERPARLGRAESLPGVGAVRGAIQIDSPAGDGCPYRISVLYYQSAPRICRSPQLGAAPAIRFAGHSGNPADPASFTDKVKARVGFSVFNLLNRFNPRDVQSDIDSDRFGAMFNGVGRILRGKFVLEF